MAEGIGVTVDTSQLDELVRQLREGPAILRRLTVQTLKNRAAEAQRQAIANVKSKLKRRTGHLLQSIHHRVIEEGADVLARVGVLRGSAKGKTLVYAPVQEFGSDGPIKPKKRLLTIPLAASLTPSGVPKWTALEAKKAFPGGTFWRSTNLGGSGNAILFGVKKLGGKWGKAQLVPLFVGVRQVTIPARPYVRPAVEQVMPQVQTDLQSGLIARLIQERRNG